MKSYEYQTVIIPDRGHLDDPEFLRALNEQGRPQGEVKCPLCGEPGHAFANGWKHKEEAAVGANKLAVLLEREVEFTCESASRAHGMDTTITRPQD